MDVIADVITGRIRVFNKSANIQEEVLDLMYNLGKINNKVKLWYSKRKTLQALAEIIGKILFDGLLISIPYWIFIEYNIYTIFAFGSALMVFKKQLLPIILKILNSFSIVKVNNK